MKVLFIGGTGLISSACSELAVQRGIQLTILNRAQSRRYPPPAAAELLTADVHANPAGLAALLAERDFDVVVDWIAYTPQDIERDLTLFTGKTGQFIFISSASAYQKPLVHYMISEETPLENPYWQYSRDKIACETRLMEAFHRDGFPVTIVRPSLTYGPSNLTLCTNSWQHPYTIIARMRAGKPVIVPGDGTSLWVCTWNGDFAVGFLGLFGRPDTLGEVFHITSGEVLTWNQLYTQVYSALRVTPNIVHIPSDWLAAWDAEYTGSLIGDKSNSVVFDNSKIKRFVPEFDCQVPWSEGVKRVIAWFDADASRRTIDAESDQQWDAIITAYARAFPVPKKSG
ncbi:MAG: SDR family oxidoreductase [Anaerolineaceae bacterium]|nr:SDR family oxidoreductase [Anaerolineaceae bacterium]MBN2677327.1 SDR family oxidoreductase [Anaerolineaceae bacterium]